MIGFVMGGTNNLDKAIKFYDTLLNTIELQRVVTNEKYAGFASKEKLAEVEFYVTNPVNNEKANFGNGTQISFLVNSRKQAVTSQDVGRAWFFRTRAALIEAYGDHPRRR